MMDMGACSYYLGIHITRDRAARTIRLSQESYIQKILEKYGMADSTPVSTPMETGLHLTPETEREAPEARRKAYSGAVGSLMYPMIETRPDIAFVMSTLARFLSNSSSDHWAALKRVFCYLNGTRDLGIVYGRGNLYGYTDSDWAGDVSTRKSTTGYVYLLGSAAVSWSSKRQPTVALSSCEAEYMAATQAAKEAIWLRRFLTELGYTRPDIDSVTINCDNQGAITLTKNPEFHARTKHIDIQWHYVREQVEKGAVTLRFIGTAEMVADGLTKPLGRVKF